MLLKKWWIALTYWKYWSMSDTDSVLLWIFSEEGFTWCVHSSSSSPSSQFSLSVLGLFIVYKKRELPSDFKLGHLSLYIFHYNFWNIWTNRTSVISIPITLCKISHCVPAVKLVSNCGQLVPRVFIWWYTTQSWTIQIVLV